MMIAGIDVAKFIFSIFVVGIHTQPIEQNAGVIRLVVDFIFGLSVPFFFVSSSYLLFSKPTNGPIEQRQNVDAYALRLTKLYLTWTILFLPITLYEYQMNGKSVIHNTVSFFRMLLMVGEHFYSWPLWYLLASVYGILIIRVLIGHKYAMPIFAFLLLLLSEFLTRLANGEMSYSSYAQTASGIIRCTISSGRIFSGLPYLVAGYYLTRPFSCHAVLTTYFLGVIGCVLCLLRIPYVSAMSMLPVCMAIFLVVKGVKFKSLAIYPKLRRASTVIYFSHMYFYFIISLIARNFHWHGWVPFVGVVCCSLVLALAVVQLEKRIKVFKVIFG